MRPSWHDLERRRASQVWQRSQARFAGAVLGPHFEGLCRAWAADFADPATFGGVAADVGRGVVNDPDHRTSHEVDVAVLAPPGTGARRVLSLGEAKWGQQMGKAHVERLARVRDLLARRGYDTRATRLACYSGAGFTADLTAAARRGEVLLIDPERLYRVPGG